MDSNDLNGVNHAIRWSRFYLRYDPNKQIFLFHHLIHKSRFFRTRHSRNKWDSEGWVLEGIRAKPTEKEATMQSNWRREKHWKLNTNQADTHRWIHTSTHTQARLWTTHKQRRRRFVNCELQPCNPNKDVRCSCRQLPGLGSRNRPKPETLGGVRPCVDTCKALRVQFGTF